MIARISPAVPPNRCLCVARCMSQLNRANLNSSNSVAIRFFSSSTKGEVIISICPVAIEIAIVTRRSQESYRMELSNRVSIDFHRRW